jgi:hypothetical protein
MKPFPFTGCLSVSRIILACLGGFLLASPAAFAADQTPSPQPDPSLLGTRKREVKLQITFGASGHVSACDVISSSGSPKLDAYTVSFIKKNWIMPSEAGKSARLPIDYEPAPAAVAQKPASPTTPPSAMPANNPWGYTSGGGSIGGAPGGTTTGGGVRGGR